MNTVIRNTLARRPLMAQFANADLANKIFNEALTIGVTYYGDIVKYEYTTNNVPETGKGIYKMWCNALKRVDNFRVFNGANDADNLYFTPETNLLYRTLHDIDHALHYNEGKGTTSKDNELYLNCLMAKRAYTYAIKSGYTQAQAIMTFLAVYHDTVGQVYYYFKNNDFCENQKALTNELLASCQGMAYLNSGSVTSAKQYVFGLMNECKVDIKDL